MPYTANCFSSFGATFDYKGCLVPSRSRSIILRIFELIIKESGSERSDGKGREGPVLLSSLPITPFAPAFPRIMGDWGRGSFIPPSAELGKACGGGSYKGVLRGRCTLCTCVGYSEAKN